MAYLVVFFGPLLEILFFPCVPFTAGCDDEINVFQVDPLFRSDCDARGAVVRVVLVPTLCRSFGQRHEPEK